MKRLIFIALALCIAGLAWAQIPDKISYQAVIRDSQNQLVSSKAIGLRISVIQGSLNGPIVYSEIFNSDLHTDANGLLTVEIGGGIPVTGLFSSINWGAGPYFIKTEIDPAGGTNYAILGISQILSVPYAFHSRTVEYYPESDPAFTASPAAGITNSAISDWSTAFSWGNHAEAGYIPGSRRLTINETTYDLTTDRAWNVGTVTNINTENGITGGPITVSGTIGLTGQALALHNLNVTGLIVRSGSSQFAGRIIEGGNGVSVTNGDGVNGNPVISLKTYKIGDFANGGIVFWTDESGRHGLVCAKEDCSSGGRWYAGTLGSTHAKGDGPFAGMTNTGIIIAAHVAIGDDGKTYAARLCNELVVHFGGTNYGDWYLPSKTELELIFQNREIIDSVATANGGKAFVPDFYWSSTEIDHQFAWYKVFYPGANDPGTGNKMAIGKVRAIRAF